MTAAKDTNYAGFSLSGVKFNTNFKANPLYPNQYEVDFLLCFRRKAKADEVLT